MDVGERVESRTKLSLGKRFAAFSIYLRLAAQFELKKLGGKAPPVWLFGSLVWGMASYGLISRYASFGNLNDLNELKEMWLIYSLFWAQFGLAGVMVSLVKKARDKVYKYLFVTAIPPLLLHVAIFSFALK